MTKRVRIEKTRRGKRRSPQRAGCDSAYNAPKDLLSRVQRILDDIRDSDACLSGH